MSQQRGMTNALVNLWFQSFNESKRVESQGQILAKLDTGYLVQFDDYARDIPMEKKILREDDMVAWTFYDSHEAMNEAQERQLAKRMEEW